MQGEEGEQQGADREAPDQNLGLTAFADASLTSYCAVVYVIWPLVSGAHETRILITKSRMIPKEGITVLQAEMCGVVIMSRLVVLASLHLAGQIQRISMSTHSKCVVSSSRRTATR